MTGTKGRETAARLRAILREGDPAGDGGSLPPERVREMRRRVLGSLAPRRPPRLLWAASAASAAMAVLALVVTLALHREVPPPAPGPETSPAPIVPTAPTAPPAVLPAPVPPGPAVAPPPAASTASEGMARRSRSLARGPRRVARAAAPATTVHEETPAASTASAASAAPLQIQFNTPGGTRVIWVLDPPDHP